MLERQLVFVWGGQLEDFSPPSSRHSIQNDKNDIGTCIHIFVRDLFCLFCERRRSGVSRLSPSLDRRYVSLQQLPRLHGGKPE
jgi:hypothetical protein